MLYAKGIVDTKNEKIHLVRFPNENDYLSSWVSDTISYPLSMLSQVKITENSISFVMKPNMPIKAEIKELVLGPKQSILDIWSRLERHIF